MKTSVLIIAHNEEVVVEQGPEGIMIQSPSLQPYVEMQQKSQVEAEIKQYDKQLQLQGLVPTSSLLPFPLSKSQQMLPFMKGMSDLRQKLNAIPDSKDKLPVHFEIAKWYAQNDFSAEALGVLDYIKSVNSDISFQKSFLMLHGALAYRLHDFAQARQDFTLLTSLPLSFKEQQEVAFWDALTQVGQRQTVADIPYKQYLEDFLRVYPASWRVPLGLDAAQWALASEEGTDKARFIIGSLVDEKDQAMQANEIRFMKAQLLMKQKEFDEAKAILQELMGDPKDRLNRARAEYNLIRIQLDQKQIDPIKAAERLQRLAFV